MTALFGITLARLALFAAMLITPMPTLAQPLRIAVTGFTCTDNLYRPWLSARDFAGVLQAAVATDERAAALAWVERAQLNVA